MGRKVRIVGGLQILIAGCLILLILFHGCGERKSENRVQMIESPAGPGSGEPNLFAAADGHLYLSWIEPVGDNDHVLRYSFLEGDGWSQSKTISVGDDWFVNWADFPSVVRLNDGSLAAHWLAKSGKGTYAYDVNISFSQNGGDTWSAPIVPHRDSTLTEHGFVSLLPWEQNHLLALWLDGRNFGEGPGKTNEMTLRSATIDQNGQLHEEWELDDRICDCCQTSAALTADGAIVVFRDRSGGEIRDISTVRFTSGGWTRSQPVHADGWKIAGCPVNGPAVASLGNQVAVGWFTAAQDTPMINVSFSQDGGASFSGLIRVDDGTPLGRVDLVMLDDGSAVLSWVEQSAREAEIRIRKVRSDGTMGKSMTIATTSPERASGFPRMGQYSGGIVIAWTEAGSPSQVKTAKLGQPDL